MADCSAAVNQGNGQERVSSTETTVLRKKCQLVAKLEISELLMAIQKKYRTT